MLVDHPRSVVAPLRLAIVGCGAISHLGHGPASFLSKRTRITTLVDLNIGRARAMGALLGVTDCRDSLEGLESSVDGAVVAVPHSSHVRVGVDLMSRGIHVLMEKPLGCSVAECNALAEAAKTRNVVLAVALVRRFVAVNRVVKKIIESGLLGSPISFEIFDAREFSWPLRTTFLLDPGEPGRGVLMGNGSHIFDLALWWFGGVADVACIADTDNGAETDATVNLTMNSGVTGRLYLSRVRDLGAMATIQFEGGRISVPAFGPDISIETGDCSILKGIPNLKGAVRPDAGLSELMAVQLDDFAAAVRGEKEPEAGPAIATETISLVERCMASIEVFAEPWWDHPVVIPKINPNTSCG
jgi:predicted dehydrogenase